MIPARKSFYMLVFIMFLFMVILMLRLSALESKPLILTLDTPVSGSWTLYDGSSVGTFTYTLRDAFEDDDSDLYRLKMAIEKDIHAKDNTWHRTHEEIDEKEW
jgi:hypothetical protein